MNNMFEETCKKMRLFNAEVVSIDQSFNKLGHMEGKIVVTAYDDMNLPKDILDLSMGMTQSMAAQPISLAGQLAVQEHITGPTEYNITFKYDRRFIYVLDHAHEMELYKQHNKEADEFIEKWLGEDNGI